MSDEELIAELRAENRRMRAALDRIAGIIQAGETELGHHKLSSFGHDWCGLCQRDWPCRGTTR